MARLETLLWEAGIESNESSTVEALRKEVARLRKALAVPEVREGAVGPRPAETRRRRTALERSPDQKDTIRTLRKDITRLNNEVVRRDKQILQMNKRLDQEKQSTENIRETARKLSSESLRLHREVRILRDSEARARSLSDEVFWLRHALKVSKAGQEKLKARLVKLRAAGATLSKLPCDEAAQLRAALRRSRRQTTTINALRKENARLHRTVRKLETRKAALEVQPAKLRAVRKTLSKSLSVADADLRRALRRSRRQKATIKSLSRENARLRKGAKTSREPDRDAGSPACEASRDRGSAVESALRPQERAAGEAALEASARSAARRRAATVAPNGPGSRSVPKSTTRRRMRASAHGAGSPMRPTAPRNPPSSRSRSRPTSGCSAVRAGAGPASARRRPWKCRRRRCRACSAERFTGPASGRASCSSTVPACAPCTALPRGCPARGWRSRRGRWPIA